MASVPPPAPPHPAPPELPEVPAGVTPAPRRATPWAPWSAIGALFAALAGATILGGVVFAIGGDFDDPPPAASITATILQDLCFIGAAWLFASISGRPRPSQFGLRPPRRPWHAVGWVLLGYVAFLSFTAIWLTLLDKTDTQDDLTEQLGADESTVALIAVAFLVTVMAPLAEELLFRGYIFGALRNWRGVGPATVITGVLFGAVHAGSSHVEFLLPLAVLGAALCIIYVRTGSLYPCIVLHCINNSLAFGTSESWTWQIPVMLATSLTLIAGLVWLIRRVGEPPAAAPAHA